MELSKLWWVSSKNSGVPPRSKNEDDFKSPREDLLIIDYYNQCLGIPKLFSVIVPNMSPLGVVIMQSQVKC